MSAAARRHQARLFLALVSLVISVYLLTFRAIPQSGDTLQAFDAVSSAARYGDWLMDESNWAKPSTRIRESQGLPLAEYAVEERLNALLAIPLFKLAEWLPRLGNLHAVWLLNVIICGLCAGLVYLLARAMEYRDAVAALLAVCAGLGTNLWAYSQTFFREPLAACLLLAAFLALQLGQGASPRTRLASLALAALALILACAAKYSAALAIPALLVFALPVGQFSRSRHARRVAWIALLTPLILLFLFMFVAPLSSAMSRPLARIGLESDYIGIALRAYLLSPGASLWASSPLLLLALPGCVVLWRRERRLVIALSCLLVGFTLGHALLTGRHWFGGLSFPPRFLLPATPVLLLAAAPLAENMLSRRRFWLRFLWFGLLGYGIWIQFSAVSLSWIHFGESLPPGASGLAEWAPAMLEPRYFRWFVTPGRWADLGLEFLWQRADQPVASLSFALMALFSSLTLFRLLRNPRGPWPYAPGLLAIALAALTLLNLSAAYERDPRAQSSQAALHEAFAFLAENATVGDALVLPSNHYVPFIMNHQDSAWPRPVALSGSPAQAASPKQPATVFSENPYSWFDSHSLRVVQHLAGKRERLWLLANTSPFMRWSFRPLERYLAQHYYPLREIPLSAADPSVRLLEYSTRSPAPNPLEPFAGDIESNLVYGDRIRLLSLELPNGVVYRPGETIELSLLWRAEAQVREDYTVAWFIVAENSGPPITQGTDSGPQAGFAPTSSWQPGAPIWDNRALRLPSDASAGPYRIWVLLYRVNDSGAIERLPVRGGDVAEAGTVGVLPLVIRLE